MYVIASKEDVVRIPPNLLGVDFLSLSIRLTQESFQNKVEAFLLGQRIATILTQRRSMGQLSPLETSGFPEIQAARGRQSEPASASEQGTGGAEGGASVGKGAQRPSMLTRGATAEEDAEEAEYA